LIFNRVLSAPFFSTFFPPAVAYFLIFFRYFYCYHFSAKIIYLFQVQRGTYKSGFSSTRVYFYYKHVFVFFFNLFVTLVSVRSDRGTAGGHTNAKKIIDTKNSNHLHIILIFSQMLRIQSIQKNWQTDSFPIIASD